MVVGFLSCDVYFISVDVGSLEGCHIGVSERGEGTEAEEVSGFGESSGFLDCLFVFFSVGIMQLDLGSVLRNLVGVEFEQFFFGEEDNRLVKNFDLAGFFPCCRVNTISKGRKEPCLTNIYGDCYGGFSFFVYFWV